MSFVDGSAELRVVLADDHDMFRTTLRHLLEENGPVRIVGESATGESAVELTADHAPDVVVMDLSMPGGGGVEAIRAIRRQSPLTQVVVLTISADEADVLDAIVAGACGYLLKSASIEDLIAGIRAAANGTALISPEIAARLLEVVRSQAQPSTDESDPPLSAREIEVLRLVAAGKDNAEIAQDLFISPKTVKNHISNILMKLQISNRIQAAVYAVRRGIV
jgi:DNA-binding NarL/FixJ family response regulator